MKRIVIAIIGTALIVGPLGYATADSRSAATLKQLNFFAQVFDIVRLQYVEPVPDEKLVEGAIGGMATSLDPHSNYLSANEFANFSKETRGEFGGIGLEVTDDNGIIKVVSPLDDTPASRANIVAGDLITHVNGEPIAGLGLNDAVEKLTGKPGTTVSLTIRHSPTLDSPASAPFDVTLTREIIKVASVKSSVQGGDVGYIRIADFWEQAEPGLENAIRDLKHKLGPKLTGFVIDLRNNPGGLLNEAAMVSNTFLDDGEIVSVRGRDPDDVEHISVKPRRNLTGAVPIVVLINGGSASASEIVAGALQDHHRAVIMGTQSFGKGSVQTILPLGNGGALRLTTARYFTPSGRSIQAKGITPDIEVKPAKLAEAEEEKRPHEADLKGALPNPGAIDKAGRPIAAIAPSDRRTAEAKPPAVGKPNGATPQKPDANDDVQLDRAIDLLHRVLVYNSPG